MQTICPSSRLQATWLVFIWSGFLALLLTACSLAASAQSARPFLPFMPTRTGSVPPSAARPSKQTDASLGAAIEKALYAVEPSGKSDGIYRADNPRQGFDATFTPDGLRLTGLNRTRKKQPLGRKSLPSSSWQWNLRLTGMDYGSNCQLLPIGTRSANGTRLQYQRGLLSEWYVNRPEGIEQGFTLAKRPAGRIQGALTLTLAVADGWIAATNRQADSVHFVNGGKTLLYAGLKACDAKGRKLPARMEAKGRQVRIHVEDSKAVYPLTIDPLLSQQTEITASDGAQNNNFGASVAISGDTAIVGAAYAGNGTGAAYVFVRNGLDGWTQKQELTAPDGGMFFGTSLSISGNTAVVTALNTNINIGVAYVFVRDNQGNWIQQIELIASDGATFSYLPGGVSINGDTVLVGAPSENNNTGAAYVFVRSNGGWTQQAELTASDGAQNDYFGGSVSVSGNTAIVGADQKQPDSAAYVFVRDDQGVWKQQAELAASDGVGFGFSVCISGDTVLVGDNGTGAAYVFVRSGGSWMQQQELTASDGATFLGGGVSISGDTAVMPAFDWNLRNDAVYVFVRDSQGVWTQQQKMTMGGSSVCISGNAVLTGAAGDNNGTGAAYVFDLQQESTALDGAQNDGFGGLISVNGDTAIVGAQGKNNNTGAAYVFVRSGGIWVQQQELTASDGAQGDVFGSSISVNGDTAIVGAQGKNNNTGAVYAFVRDSQGNWTQQTELKAADGGIGDEFGWSASLSGDTAIVGAQGKNNNTGAAYVFVRSGGIWVQQQELTASDGAQNDKFGDSVCISGDTVIVGAYSKNNNTGAVYVFVRDNQGHWTQQQELTVAYGYHFGDSVCISGDTVIVGTLRKYDLMGIAYVFVRSGSIWTQQQELIASDGVGTSDGFGEVSISGDTALAGAWDQPPAGAAYVFVRSGGVWTQQQKLKAADGVPTDYFGWSVGVSGGTVIVGTPVKNNWTGAAYVWGRSVVTRDDIYIVAPNTALTVGTPGVLSNDPGNNQHSLTARLVVAPTAGSLTFNSDGSFVYTPAHGAYGTFRFAYQATDGTDVSDLTWVTINVKANTLLQVANATGTVGKAVTLRALLRSKADGSRLSGKTVGFTVNGVSAGTAVTDGTGMAYLAYTVPDTFGSNLVAFTASFGGDDSYNPSTSTAGTLSVQKGSIYLTVGTAVGKPGRTVLLRALLRRIPDALPLSGKTVTFSVDGAVVGTAISGNNGLANYSYVIPAGTSPGSHTITATFAGDNAYNPTTSTVGTLTVQKADIYLTVGYEAGKVGQTVPLRALLRRIPDALLLSGKTVTFKVDGVTVGTAVSGSNGLASYSYVIPAGTSAGSHTITATFAGDSDYNAASGTNTLTVNP